jgi:energy-coupling factor transporter ATP-binding protein EcfA2
MLIKKIEIKNFRRLIGPVLIENLKSGINVIAGDNEEGKSTILQALKALFFQRYNSTSQTVSEFQPYNCVVRPEVAIDFEWNSDKFSLRKGFCVKPYLADFRSLTGHSQGAEAEEQMSELFRLPGGEKGRSAANADHGLWGLLWMEQGTASNGLNMTAGGKESLLKALESDLGSLTGGQSGRALLKNVQARCKDYFTATGRETGVLKDSRAALLKVTEEHTECEQKFEQYKLKSARLSKIQESLANHVRDKTLDTAKARLVEVEKALRQLNDLKIEDRAAKESERATSLEFNAHKDKLKNRLDLTARELAIKQNLLEKESQIKLALVELEKCNEVVDACQKDFDGSVSALKSAEQAILDIEKRDQLLALKKAQLDLQQTLITLTELQTTIDSQTAESQAITIDQNVFNELKSLDVAALEAEIEARVASARLVLKPLEQKQAFINEKEILSGEQISIAELTTIILKDWGEIDITPGGEDTAQLVKTAKFKRQKFAAALRKFGLVTLHEASELLDKRKQLQAEIEQANARIKMLSAGGSLQTLQKDLQKIDAQIQQLQQLQQLQQSGTPVKSNVEGDINEFRNARDLARQAETKRRQTLDTAKLSASKATIDVNARTSEKANLAHSLTEIEKQLADISKTPLEAHEQAVKDSERAYLEARDRSKLITLKITEIDGASTEKLYETTKSAAQKIENEIRDLQINQANLSGEITAEGNAGLGETLERLRGQHELAETEFNRTEKRAKAFKLLQETLLEAEQEAKEHFLEPVFEKLKPHLQVVFPGANIVMNKQDVEIAHLQRNGINEHYMSLSTGTREQLSVLTRLAIARMLKERNQPSFVVLDDALVYSDARRFAQMKEVLQEVAADVQILILTCRKSDYLDLAEGNFIDFCSKPSVLT